MTPSCVGSNPASPVKKTRLVASLKGEVYDLRSDGAELDTKLDSKFYIFLTFKRADSLSESALSYLRSEDMSILYN